ncbi:MAG: UMP kinase [Candidatus Heimdallarchaeota archaeon]|nr:UMP kinase [Candidatus Heimdallarchaeota archaeon]MDH5646260.1 UMP kinase [Candidatus Heimdallarchaeota archaeon]
MRLILKIGGSLLFKDGNIQVDLLNKYISIIRELRSLGHIIGVVVGGGYPARQYTKAANQLGASNSYMDIIGIEAAKQNARLLISGIQEAHPIPPSNYNELLLAISTSNLVIIGGLQPGQSTNAVAALFAETLGADYLINLTDISKVYDMDPKLNKDAKPLDTLSYQEFSKIIQANPQVPSGYKLFDTLGVTIVERSKIKLVFINGNQPEKIKQIIKNEPVGTIIQ